MRCLVISFAVGGITCRTRLIHLQHFASGTLYTQTWTTQQRHENHLQRKLNIPIIFCGVNLNILTNKISVSCEVKNIICKNIKWRSLCQGCQIQYWYHQLHKHNNQFINCRNVAVMTQRKAFLVSHTSVVCYGRVVKPPSGGSDCWQDKHSNRQNPLPIKLNRQHQHIKCFLFLRTHHWPLPKKAVIVVLESFSLKRMNLKYWYLSTMLCPARQYKWVAICFCHFRLCRLLARH